MLNDRELDVLNILYKKSEPMMAMDIVNAGEGLTQSTVTAVLRKLYRAGLVEVTGVTHSGKVLSRTYVPSKKAKVAIIEQFMGLYARFKNVVSADELCKNVSESVEQGADVDSKQDLTKETEKHEGKVDTGKILALYKARWSIKNIAVEMGCSPQTVRNVLRDENQITE